MAILFILFISLFALDTLDGNQSLWTKIGGFFVHLLPSAILAAILVLSWRREWIGGIAFLVLGIFYIVIVYGKFPFVTYLIISGPLFIIAVSFWISWFSSRNSKLKGTSTG
jgi:hypothetical protein